MNTDVIAPIVNFVTVVGALGYFCRKPFQDFLQNRSDSIRKQIEEAQTESAKVFSELAELEKAKAERGIFVAKSQEDAKAALVRHREKTLEHARTEATRIVKEGELLGQGEVAKKVEALQKEISERSVALAKKYLGEQLDQKDSEKLISEYVESVRNG